MSIVFQNIELVNSMSQSPNHDSLFLDLNLNYNKNSRNEKLRKEFSQLCLLFKSIRISI